MELNLTPEFSQFEGFINYGTPILTNGTNILGEFVSIPLSDNRILQPVFRTLRENTSVVVWDGALSLIHISEPTRLLSIGVCGVGV